MAQLLANFQFQATGHRLIVLARFQLVGEVILTSGVGVRFIVCIAVLVAIANCFISLVGALRRCNGTSSEPCSAASRRAVLNPTYTALLLGAQAR